MTSDPDPRTLQISAEDAVDRPFTRHDLRTRGFEGFLAFHCVDLHQVPAEPGVYVVLRESDQRPTFLSLSPAGWFQGRDPTVAIDELEADWPDGAHCVYIGKAASGATGKRGLRKRIEELRHYGDGHPVAHQGGRRIWQLADADTFVLAWQIAHGDTPEEIEGQLIREFVAAYGRKPIGNRTLGRRPRWRG